MDVVEMLELATNAQKEVQLTEYEFVKQMRVHTQQLLPCRPTLGITQKD